MRNILLALIVMPITLLAQFQQAPQPDEKELIPVSTTYAITGVNIIQAPGKKIDRGTVVLENGLIQSVGKNVQIPAEAIVIKADSMYVYAGFIDGLSRTSVIKPKEDPAQSRERPKDPGNPSPEVAGVTPQNDVRAILNPADKTVDDLRAQGFTAVQVVPYGGMLPGSAAVILLKGKTADEMILVNKTALFSELAPAQRVYPNTVIGVMAKWRELYRQAQQSKNYESLYASNRTGLNRPASDRILEAFYPVLDQQIPMLFEADRYLDVQRVLALKSELGFPLVVGDVKEGWDAIQKLKTANAKVFLSLDLPEEKKEPASATTKTGANKPIEIKEEATPSISATEKQALEKRKSESLALYKGQAAAFQKAGIVFGFSALTVKTTDIRSNLRRMIEAGLTEDQALAALTTNPAQLLGLSDRLGTIETGKIANLVISDKPYFHEKSKIRYVFVDGVLHKYDTKETPKTDPAVVINITGTWSVTTETPQGKSEEKVTFKKDGNTYGGSITIGPSQQAVSLEDVELTGNNIKYSYTMQAEGQTVKVDVQATIEGDSFKGSATAGRFGAFPVEGKKDPNR